MNDKQFKEWENETFGFGYGTGEEYTLPLLKKAFDLFPESGTYDYVTLEKELGQTTFWLLLNTLAHSPGVINYGTSSRYGWLDEKGKEIKTYLSFKSENELYSIVMKDELE